MEKAEQDKQSAIIRAQGEAQSAKLIGEAIRGNPAFLMLRKIEVGLWLYPRTNHFLSSQAFVIVRIRLFQYMC